MSRLSITLDDDIHSALKATAAIQRRSMAAIIEESLRLRGIKPQQQVEDILKAARDAANASDLNETQLMDMAVTETRAARELNQ